MGIVYYHSGSGNNIKAKISKNHFIRPQNTKRLTRRSYVLLKLLGYTLKK